MVQTFTYGQEALQGKMRLFLSEGVWAQSSVTICGQGTREKPVGLLGSGSSAFFEQNLGSAHPAGSFYNELLGDLQTYMWLVDQATGTQ